MPAIGARLLRHSQVVQATIGGAIRSYGIVAERGTNRWYIIQVLCKPGVITDFHGTVALAVAAVGHPVQARTILAGT